MKKSIIITGYGLRVTGYGLRVNSWYKVYKINETSAPLGTSHTGSRSFLRRSQRGLCFSP